MSKSGQILLTVTSILSAVILYSHLTSVTKLPPGTVVLICGASSGIGEELAYQAAEDGARLALVARSLDKLVRVKEEALVRGAQGVEVLVSDFSDVVGSSAVVNRTVQRFGRLDYLVLNHVGAPLGPFLAVKSMQNPAFIEKIFRVNFFSNIQLTLEALPHLEASLGHIFVTSSTFGEMPINYGMALYSASKHAMNGFFYSIQQELLAKKSPISLTLGALGLILTPDIEQLWKNDTLPINLISGSIQNSARGILDSYTSRPYTWSYPALPSYFMRAMWYFNPWFQKMAVFQSKQPGSRGWGYEASVLKWEEKVHIATERRFGSGYNERYSP